MVGAFLKITLQSLASLVSLSSEYVPVHAASFFAEIFSGCVSVVSAERPNQKRIFYYWVFGRQRPCALAD